MTKEQLIKSTFIAVGIGCCLEIGYRIGQGHMLGTLKRFEISPESAYESISTDERIRFKLIKSVADVQLKKKD